MLRRLVAGQQKLKNTHDDEVKGCEVCDLSTGFC